MEQNIVEGKDIKDYLHLYLWCEVMYDGTKCKLFGVHQQYCVIEFPQIGMVKIGIGSYSQVKPILRTLASMTDEEIKELDATKAFQRASPVHQIGIRVWTAESYLWALSKHFDLFNLIPEGLAIDATLKTKP